MGSLLYLDRAILSDEVTVKMKMQLTINLAIQLVYEKVLIITLVPHIGGKYMDIVSIVNKASIIKFIQKIANK